MDGENVYFKSGREGSQLDQKHESTDPRSLRSVSIIKKTISKHIIKLLNK